MTDHVAYASSNKTKIVLNRDGTLFFLSFFKPGVDAPHVYMCAWALGCFHSHISTHYSLLNFVHALPKPIVQGFQVYVSCRSRICT